MLFICHLDIACLPELFFPSLVAVDKGSSKVVAVGKEALRPDIRHRYKVVHPIRPSNKVDQVSMLMFSWLVSNCVNICLKFHTLLVTFPLMAFWLVSNCVHICIKFHTLLVTFLYLYKVSFIIGYISYICIKFHTLMVTFVYSIGYISDIYIKFHTILVTFQIFVWSLIHYWLHFVHSFSTTTFSKM